MPPDSDNYPTATKYKSPRQNIIPDCIRIIFHYHIFYIGIDHDTISEGCYRYDGTPITEGSLNWRFLQELAYCVSIHFRKNHLADDISLIPLIDFLHRCRLEKHRETFHYLGFSRLHMGLVPDLLRGVKHLDLTIGYRVKSESTDVSEDESVDKLSRILQKMRGIETLELDLRQLPADRVCFNSLGGIQTLKLQNFFIEECDPVDIFKNLRGIKTLVVERCVFFRPSSVLRELRGIEDLTIRESDTQCLNAEHFHNLRGIRRMCIAENAFQLTDEITTHLRGIEELAIACVSENTQLTDRGFKNLRGIRDLALWHVGKYPNITDAAFSNLRGIESLCLNSSFPQLTDAIFEQLRGVRDLVIGDCPNIRFRAETLENLRGVYDLEWTGAYDRPDVEERLLTEECSKHLAGTHRVYVEGVSVESDEAFRPLKHVPILILYGPVCFETGFIKQVPLGDKAFSYLKNVTLLQLDSLTFNVSNFRKLFRECMPKLQYGTIEYCNVLKRSLMGYDGEGPMDTYFYREIDAEWAIVSFDCCRR